MNLWKFIKDNMKDHLQQTVSEGKVEKTYEEIIDFAEQFSKQLKGIKCCAILCRSELNAAMALLGCFAAGVTAVPLSQRYGELHCNKILDSISPQAVITDQNGELKILRVEEFGYIEPKVHPALIMCTSGTSGIPKGAMLTEANIMTNVSDIMGYFSINESDSILISRPLYHCAVLTGEFITSLIKGVKIRFYSGGFNPAIVLKLLKEHRITAFCGTPTLLSIISKFKRKNDEDYLKHICISGECMSLATAQLISKAFPKADKYHVYGLTEASPRVSFLPPHMFDKYADFVGLPLRSVSLKIVSAQGEPVETNEVGTLWVKGENVMQGYYNNPQKTSEVLKDGWLCTGDLALFNKEGLLKIKGRADDLIIKAGMNIYPQEIENALRFDKRVKEVCVSSYDDEKLGVQIALKISGDFSNANEVIELCQMYLPAYQVPTRISLLDEIPKNGSGKIIRR